MATDSFLTDEAKAAARILLGIDTKNEYESAMTDEAKTVCRKLLGLEEDNEYDSFLSGDIADYIKELLGVEESSGDEWNFSTKLLSTTSYPDNACVDSLVLKNDTITISARLSDMTGQTLEFQLKTGIKPITKVTFNDNKIDSDDADEYKSVGCDDDGIWMSVFFGTLVETSGLTYTLEVDGLEKKTITVVGIDTSSS